MSTKWLGIVTIGFCLLIASQTSAADKPLRRARSANERFELRVEPGRPGANAVYGCRATLMERTSERHRGRKRWERFLVNEVAPTVVAIRDDGKYVITLNEFRFGGARHAVVIYGQRGELLRHFLLPDLLTANDWKHVKTSSKRIRWLDGARYRFVDELSQFVIRLKHERQIRIDLRSLKVLGDKPGAAVAAIEGIPPELLAALYGDEAAETLGSDAATAHKDDVEIAVDDPNMAAAGDETATTRAEELPDEPQSEYVSTRDGLAVPRPDPAAPFDYLTWLNEMTVTPTPSAEADYRAAMDAVAPWAGDRDLRTAALQGDDEALLSPEVQGWLDENTAALEHFYNGTRGEFDGFALKRGGDSLVFALLPSLGNLRNVSQAATIEGRTLAAGGAVSEAADTYLDVLRAGAHTSRGITLIEDLVGMAIQAPAAEALMDLAAHEQADDLDWAGLAQSADAAYRPARPMSEMLQFERAAFMDTLQSVYEVDPDSGAYVLNRQKTNELIAMGEDLTDAETRDRQTDLDRQAEFGLDSMVAAGNAYYDALTDALKLPYRDACRRLEAIHADVDAAPDSSPLLRAMAPNFANAHFAETRAEAIRRSTKLLANIQAYRQATGDYPVSLDVFAGRDFALDPFTGRPFRYTLTGDDFSLYSVGANGVDDGGVHDQKVKTNDYVVWPRPGK